MSFCETAEKLNVVILYEQLSYARKALATYSHLTRELDSEFKPDLRIWRVDVATSAEFAARADEDIAAAEVIIMAVRGSQPCPPAFLRWKGGEGPGNGMPCGAIIALVEPEAGPATAVETWHSVLRGAATQIHPEVFVWEPPMEFNGAAPGAHAGALEPAVAGG